MTTTRQLSLDGLRGAAILAVLLLHLHLLRGGYLGIDILFVLSGFLITGILLNELATTQTIDFFTGGAHDARYRLW